jgi:hypothetical protein
VLPYIDTWRPRYRIDGDLWVYLLWRIRGLAISCKIFWLTRNRNSGFNKIIIKFQLHVVYFPWSICVFDLHIVVYVFLLSWYIYIEVYVCIVRSALVDMHWYDMICNTCFTWSEYRYTLTLWGMDIEYWSAYVNGIIALQFAANILRLILTVCVDYYFYRSIS